MIIIILFDFNSILATETNQFGIPAKANGISSADAWLDVKKYGVLFDLILLFLKDVESHQRIKEHKIISEEVDLDERI